MSWQSLLTLAMNAASTLAWSFRTLSNSLAQAAAELGVAAVGGVVGDLRLGRSWPVSCRNLFALTFGSSSVSARGPQLPELKHM